MDDSYLNLRTYSSSDSDYDSISEISEDVSEVFEYCNDDIKSENGDLYSKDIFYAVCWSGNIKMIDYMMSTEKQDYNTGLDGACAGGHKEIAELMIQKGATQIMIRSRSKKHLHYLFNSNGASLMFACAYNNNWRDWMVRYSYANKYKLSSGFYDFIFIDKQKPQVIIDIRVKLFDKNLLLNM